MEKPYRDLFEELSEYAVVDPLLEALVTLVGGIDDLDPLRIPALRAMKRVPPPPINLSYVLADERLALYARNTLRKRRAPRPALCAELPVQAWLFNPKEPFPGNDLEKRGRFVELVHQSFRYLEIRITNYFEVGHDSELVVVGEPVPSLAISMHGKPDRRGKSERSARSAG